jgi:hypothetical protein
MRLAVWGSTQAIAAHVADQLGLPDTTELLFVGNWSDGPVRGRTLDQVLILPGAESEQVHASLAAAVASRPDHQWLDLR